MIFSKLVEPKSLWAHTPTYFDVFYRILESEGYIASDKSALILGCSDGKFVTPFLLKGLNVTAIDYDVDSIEGNTHIKIGEKTLDGLRKNLSFYESSKHLNIIIDDYMKNEVIRDKKFDIVLTSCSWHYKENSKYPFPEVINMIKSFVADSGFLCVDYFMPIKNSHFSREEYTTPERLLNFFEAIFWESLVNEDLGIKEEEEHPGKQQTHSHHYAAFMAHRTSVKVLAHS